MIYNLLKYFFNNNASQPANVTKRNTRSMKKELPDPPSPVKITPSPVKIKTSPKSKSIPSTPQSVQELLEQFPNSDLQEDNDGEDDDVPSIGGDAANDNNDGNVSDYLQTNEFSDSDDMLEGIRSAVDKVVGNDLGSDTKHDWLDGELGDEIIFSNADIEGIPDVGEVEAEAEMHDKRKMFKFK